MVTDDQSGGGEEATSASDGAEAAAVKDPELSDPKLYINRELSWIRFNERVLEEARDKAHPLLERAKFLAICGGNLDEFFMVRVSALQRQFKKGALELPPDGMTPSDQLTAIRAMAVPLVAEHARCWREELLPELAAAGIRVRRYDELNKEQRRALRLYFERMVLPTLTPLSLDLKQNFPFISNLSLNLAVVVKDAGKNEKYARLKIPTNLFPRFVKIPMRPIDIDPASIQPNGQGLDVVLLEDLVAANLDLLFHGHEVKGAYAFRITRNAEIEIALDEASDLLTAVEESVESRRIGRPSRLEVEASMPEKLRNLFAEKLGLPQHLVYQGDGPLGLSDLWQLHVLPRPDLKDVPFLPHTPPELAASKNLFAAIAARDYVLYHPYDSFEPVLNLLRQSARDPGVLAIKLTLYRIDKGSPVIEALLEAKESGKDVTAIVELKAKFDEQNNILWARALEHAGVHVVYGLPDLKVHAKLLLVVRREGDHIVRYSHISSGNYNAVTTRIYGDIGYLTARPEIGADIADLFNALTGHSHKEDYRAIIVAPKTFRPEISRRIEREIAVHKERGGGYIALKLNGLVDDEMISALYRASMAGVTVDLNVRGLCGLRPGLPNLSENITVISIVDRFLEHARIYHFRNGGDDEVLLGSADLLPRNLKRRIEVVFQVPDPRLKRSIVENMLKVHLADNVKARRLNPDGTYVRVERPEGAAPLHSQRWLIENRGVWHDFK